MNLAHACPVSFCTFDSTYTHILSDNSKKWRSRKRSEVEDGRWTMDDGQETSNKKQTIKNETVNGIHWMKIKNKRYLSRNEMGAKTGRKTNAPTHTHTYVYYFKHLLSFWLFYLFAFFTNQWSTQNKNCTAWIKKNSPVKIHCCELTHFIFTFTWNVGNALDCSSNTIE